MKGAMYRIEETIQKILEGKKLLLAGDEAILKTLPKGNWIAGTIPYFIASDGGVTTKNEIFITELPDFIDEINILTYDADSLKAVYQDAYENGFSIMIIPGMSNIHLNFALNAQSYDSFASKPLAGWVSGLHLDDLGRQTAKVFNGAKKAFESDKAVVMHCRLPESFYAEIGIINIFKQGSGDTIVFKEDNFNQSNALVNGVEVDFADYIKNNNINTRLPLVANYLGAMINTGFQNVDASKSTVSFYAPVFKDVGWRRAGYAHLRK